MEDYVKDNLTFLASDISGNYFRGDETTRVKKSLYFMRLSFRENLEIEESQTKELSKVLSIIRRSSILNNNDEIFIKFTKKYLKLVKIWNNRYNFKGIKGSIRRIESMLNYQNSIKSTEIYANQLIDKSRRFIKRDNSTIKLSKGFRDILNKDNK